jgi:hypothetical protein
MITYAACMISIALLPVLLVSVNLLRQLIAAVKAFHQDYKIVHNL